MDESESLHCVDQLMGLLACVKRMGWNGAFEDDIACAPVKCDNRHSYTEPLISLLRVLEDSKRCMATLNKVRDRLGKKVRALQRRVTPLVLEHGIRYLPDELLAHVFEIRHFSEETCRFALRVSQVSPRFRQIALRTPVLWTRLSTTYTIDQLETFVSRSSHLDLDVTYTVRPGYGVKFLQIAGPLSTRWSCLTVHYSHQVAELSAAGLTTFPNLKCLSHRYGGPRLYTWNMPKLSHFYGLSILTAYNPIITQLTSVDLQYSGEYFDVPSLARTLYQATNLQDLSLELRKLKVAEQATRLTSDKMPEPHSFSIKSLKLDIKGDVTMSYDVIRPLCGALSYLSPLKVDISCPLESHYYQDGTVTPYGSEIRICIAESTDIVQLLAKLVQQCSIARSVCIEAPASYFSTYYLGGGNWTWFSSLRYIRFHNCGGLTEEQVKPFAISLLADEAGMNLQSLEFTSCGNISEDFLLNLSDIVGQKLKWSR